MLKSGSCDYNDACILVKWTINVTQHMMMQWNEQMEGLNTQIENVKDIDVAMTMYDLTEYNHNYWKSTERL